MNITDTTINTILYSEILYARNCNFLAPIKGVKRMFLTNCINIQTVLDANTPDEIFIYGCEFNKLPVANTINLINSKVNFSITNSNYINIKNCSGEASIGCARKIVLTNCDNLFLAVGTCDKLQVYNNVKLVFNFCNVIYMSNINVKNICAKKVMLDRCTIWGSVKADEIVVSNSTFDAKLTAPLIHLNNCIYNKPLKGDYIRLSNCIFENEITANAVELINTVSSKIFARTVSIINTDELKIQINK